MTTATLPPTRPRPASPATPANGNGPVGTQADSSKSGLTKKVSAFVGQHKLLIVGAVVVVLGLLYLLRREPVGAGSQDTPSLTGGTGYDPAAHDTDVWDAFSQIMTGQTNGFGAILTAIQAGKTTTPTASPTTPATNTGYHVVNYGKVGTSYGLRDVARRYAGSTNPTVIESFLRRLVAVNAYSAPGHPSLVGRTDLPGGYPLRVPNPA